MQKIQTKHNQKMQKIQGNAVSTNIASLTVSALKSCNYLRFFKLLRRAPALRHALLIKCFVKLHGFSGKMLFGSK